MAGRHVLAIDEGTTGVRALVVDSAGEIRGQAYLPIDTRYPGPGLVEHDAEKIWESTLHVVRRALDGARVAPGELAAAGVATQRATVVVWDAKTSRPVHTATSRAFIRRRGRRGWRRS